MHHEVSCWIVHVYNQIILPADFSKILPQRIMYNLSNDKIFSEAYVLCVAVRMNYQGPQNGTLV
jgi:hypothetical protein